MTIFFRWFFLSWGLLIVPVAAFSLFGPREDATLDYTFAEAEIRADVDEPPGACIALMAGLAIACHLCPETAVRFNEQRPGKVGVERGAVHSGVCALRQQPA